MIITATSFEVELIKQAANNQLYTELTDLMHKVYNIYTQHLFCKEDLCMKEEVGYDCTDCLYQSIQALIWQKKFEAEANNQSKGATNNG